MTINHFRHFWWIVEFRQFLLSNAALRAIGIHLTELHSVRVDWVGVSRLPANQSSFWTAATLLLLDHRRRRHWVQTTWPPVNIFQHLKWRWRKDEHRGKILREKNQRLFYPSCRGPSHWLDWCPWCWWPSPTAHTERLAPDRSRCSASPSLWSCSLKSKAHISFMTTSQQEAQSDGSRCCQSARRAVMSHQVARRCRLPACPPARVCSGARRTPPCRQRTGSSTHAGTSVWLSWRSGGWSPGRMALVQRVRQVLLHWISLWDILFNVSHAVLWNDVR